jgi:predicted Abi (CAAX) family protease
VNKQSFKSWGLVVLALSLIVFLSPINIWWLRWYRVFENQLLHLSLDLMRICLLSLIFALLLAPFEALGWWAGWYGKNSDPKQQPLLKKNSKTYRSQSTQSQTSATHYLVYLDGIGISSFDYALGVSTFLERLTEAVGSDFILIREIMPYSVLNLPLTLGRPLAAFWRWVNQGKIRGIGVLILLRNMFQVAVSVDNRYGPIFNRGTAQVIIDSLLERGYRPGSGIPITIIGYSGGGQVALGTLPYLKKVLAAPMEVISLAGVLSGNTEVVQLEHLYHLVGEKDLVARFVPCLFPQRWSFISWSNWNLARSRGEISFISLGSVGHDGIGGPFDSTTYLPDGRSHLTQTIEIITKILHRQDGIEPFPSNVPESSYQSRKLSNYERYLQACFNQYNYYPSKQSVPSNYHPVGSWIGRLILPDLKERSNVRGIFLEVYEAPQEYRDLIGKKVILSWIDRPDLQAYLNQVKCSIHFSAQAYESMNNGLVHPFRLNFWREIDALESLVGARPIDDVIVTLNRVIVVRNATESEGKQPFFTKLYIDREPTVITGRFYGLITILDKANQPDLFRVRHYNRSSKQFDGAEEIVYIPQVIADRNGVFPSTTNKIENSPLNSTGWYIYGELNRDRVFTVRAIAPRTLFQLKPKRIISGLSATTRYLNNQYWQDIKEQKGQIDSILLNPNSLPEAEAIARYQEGDRLLLLHTYGGIGGKKAEVPPIGLFFGHFAFGIANVIRDPITGELRFKIVYDQVYTQNLDGIIAGNLDWSNYLGDRQFGWLGTRPVVDFIVKLDVLEEYNFGGNIRFPLNALAYQLDKMMARYRTGDGTGATFAGLANSCVQDSCQALYLAIKMILTEIRGNQKIQNWIADYPEDPQTKRLKRLVALYKTIERKLVPWRTVRSDWLDPFESLIGTRLAEQPVNTIINALTSWRSLLPSLANDRLAEILLEHGASLWLLKTTQVGGWDEEIEPIAPTKLWI